MFNYLVYCNGNVALFKDISTLVAYLNETTPEEDEVIEIITVRK